MSLKKYKKKRDFRKTPEPRGGRQGGANGDARYVVQKHDASRLHFDFRLQIGDVLKSWAVPKGPTVDPDVRRLAIHVEDHPLDYGDFEGTIPEDEYGGGTVMVWDCGTWEPDGDPNQQLQDGKLSFELKGARLKGHWALVKMGGRKGDDKDQWLLMKKDDKHASAAKKKDPTRRYEDSVVSGRTLDEIRNAARSDNEKPGESQEDRGKKGPSAKLKDAAGKKASPTERVSLNKLNQLDGARKVNVPKSFKPQLAVLTHDIPKGASWIYEAKYDGYRILAICRGGTWTLKTRNGKDWTERFPGIAAAVQALPVDDAILDGEIVVLNDKGISDFQALQNALRRDEHARTFYYAFDLPHCNGYSLVDVPQVERKQALRSLLRGRDEAAEKVRFSEHVEGDVEKLLHRACNVALEGLMAKRREATYVQKRSKSWLKLRCSNRQEFVIVGYTKPQGSRHGFGSLALAVRSGRKYRYSGRVGTGFDDDALRDIGARLRQREVRSPSAEGVSRTEAKQIHWVKPELVAEIEFSEWTSDGRLRHPVFHGLREDKPPTKVTRESRSSRKAANNGSRQQSTSQAGGKQKTKTSEDRIAGVKLTHPEKELYPKHGISKRELAEYYASIADWVLPHVVDRPLSLLRCPKGHTDKCFFQKHHSDQAGDAVHGVMIKEKKGQAEYLYINDLAGLIALVQLGTLELHPWGSQVDRYERPDRIIFDLDPDPSASFEDTRAAARRLHKLLAEYDLESFVKTTGGKGLHVLVPIVRRNSWDEIRTFSSALAKRLAREEPDRYVATMSKEKRKNKVFVDYLRNTQGATAVAAYSTRAKNGAPVSVPLRWDELTPGLTPDGYDVGNLHRRLSSLKDDPWAGFSQVRQSVTKSMLRDVR